MLTEEEASAKWCPFTNTRTTRCVASDCMAWRWTQKRNPDWRPDLSKAMSSYPYMPSHPDEETPAYITDKTRGYCGLAGRPS